ncbi:MAG TPA: dolichyl-phosphate beta-glucosyltransferase [Chloroflexia bacterium]|nr:dolichyl-phosphate beta-glucosyltransferase [Chloroflexia bacterium]
MSDPKSKRPKGTRNPKSDASEPYLSVVIPAYNEAARLPTTLQKVMSYLVGCDYSYEVLVVDDGSEDRTADIVDETAQELGDPNLQVVRNPHRGKGYAVRTGILQARGSFILYSDADLSAPIEEVEKLLPYLNGKYQIAIGSREGKGAVRYDEPHYRHLMGRVFNTLVRVVALPQFNDTQCGFKAFRREAAHNLFRSLHLYGDKSGDVKGAMVTGFDVEVLYLALKWGYRVKEVPIRWYYSKGANVNPVKDSYRMLKDIIKVRLNDLRGLYSKHQLPRAKDQ